MTDTRYREQGIPCEVIQDLLPSYVDGLASESAAKLIEEHVRGCAECAAMLENMRAGEKAATEPDDRDRKEIDFLKKSRKRSRRAVVLGILLTLLVTAALIGAKQFVIGSEYDGEMACDLRVDGSAMTVGVTAADSAHVIRGLDFKMEDGVATGKARAVLPGVFHSSGIFPDGEDGGSSSGGINCDWAEEFSFDEEIREVRIGDRVYWANGRAVFDKASAIFLAGHDYVGDASANGASIDALGINEDLGSLYSELTTEKRPYIWTIVLDEDQSKYRAEYLEQRLTGYGAALIGTVGNLDEVDFRYTVDGKTVVTKVTAKDASALLGRDIKACRTGAGALSDLLEKAGIDE